ncbi:MAG: hypothetical protein OEZ59_01470 [Deltaproteobacteria bacterium]|nr:hypothetical protein [Deltaproteobacteria bacterium]
MIYITTSNGVLSYDHQADKCTMLVSPAESQGFFGLDFHQSSGTIIAACRRNLRFTFRQKKHGSDVMLYRIDPSDGTARELGPVYKVFDVHQIAIHGDTVFLTDTTLNRVHVFDLASRRTTGMLNIGPRRKDINHVNAVLVRDGELLVGLNNRGEKDSEVLSIPLDLALSPPRGKVDILKLGRIRAMRGVVHSHDLEPYENGLIGCASHDGFVFRMETSEPFIRTEGWVRGLAETPEGLWVGTSRIATRAERHKGELDGRIMLFSHGEAEPRKTVPLEGAGQICDLISV